MAGHLVVLVDSMAGHLVVWVGSMAGHLVVLVDSTKRDLPDRILGEDVSPPSALGGSKT